MNALVQYRHQMSGQRTKKERQMPFAGNTKKKIRGRAVSKYNLDEIDEGLFPYGLEELGKGGIERECDTEDAIDLLLALFG